MNTKPLSFYESIIGGNLDPVRNCIPFFESRCDSLLEVLFGMCFVSTFDHYASANESSSTGKVLVDSVALWEPFNASPSLNGDSYAEMTCQENVDGLVWDFGIHTSTDNGGSNCALKYLIDIDGYRPHKDQREWDEKKSQLPSVKTIRIREELFKNPQQMAYAALWASIWRCGCGEIWGSGEPCHYCEDLKGRLIFGGPET